MWVFRVKDWNSFNFCWKCIVLVLMIGVYWLCRVVCLMLLCRIRLMWLRLNSV